jgi:branched-chain amino acid transport system substrate-binding protein
MSRSNISRREFIQAAVGAGFAIAGLSSVPLLSSCGPKAKPGQKLRVGLMSPSTGPVPEKGIPARDGFLDGFAYINAEKNGVNGYQIEPIYRDSGYDMNKVVTIVNEFLDLGCLLFVTHSSTEMNAAKAIANPEEFPGIATFTSQTNYHPPLHIYGQMPDYGDDWVAFARYYKDNVWKGSGKPKMALHLLNNATGKGAQYGADAMAASIGIDIVATEEHPSTLQSAIESLTRIKAKGPDVLFISSTPQPSSVIIKDAASMGMYPGMTIGCAHASFTKALIDLAGANTVEGVYGVFPTVSWDDNVSGVAKATEYCKKNNPADYGNMDYLSTWSSGLIIAEILRLAVTNAGYATLAKGNVDSWRAMETQGLQKLKGYKVEDMQGPVSYTPGDNRLDKELRLYKISGGKIVMIQDWTQAPFIKYEDFTWFPKQ